MKKKLLFVLVACLSTTLVCAQHEHVFTRSDVTLDTKTFDFIQFIIIVFSAWCSYAMSVKRGAYFLGYLVFPLYLGLFYAICPYDARFFVLLSFPLVLGCLIGYVLYKMFYKAKS